MRWRAMCPVRSAAGLALLSALAAPAAGQDRHMHDASVIGAMGVLLLTHVSPAALGASRSEGYLTQPMVAGQASVLGSRLLGRLILNFEDLTLRRGELTPGIYGEGYIDRRHPHTLVHEAVVVGAGSAASLSISLAGGKGFVPFGSDDPMSRPFVKYPVNHHLAQVLERAIVVAAVRWRVVAFETAVFNGDEPEGTRDTPNVERLGDSWSVRATAWPASVVEVSSSVARVNSPEDAGGFGLDHRMTHIALRLGGVKRLEDEAYVLVEFARTDAYRGSTHALRFSSVLAEASLPVGDARAAIRLERTTRPDEERIADLFRSRRPPLDLSVLGRSRWDVVSAGLAARPQVERRWALAPFVELQLAHVRATFRPSVFEPANFYGRNRIWALSVGARMHAGHRMQRTGRYGVAAGES